MPKLAAEKQINGTKKNLARILDAYGIFDFSSRLLTGGIENSSFCIESVGKKHVLRIYRQDKKSATDIVFELKFQDLLREKGIPIPLIFRTASGSELASAYIAGKTWHAILMEFVEGSNLTRHYSPQLMSELATYQSRMHHLGLALGERTNKPKVKWKELRDSIANTVLNTSVYDQEEQKFIWRVREYHHLLSPDLPHGFNHLDLDLDGNILTRDNHIVAILDFDDLEYSPIITCLGYTLWDILFLEGEERMREYLAEYVSRRALSNLEYETLPHILFFRNYVIGIIDLVIFKNRGNIQKILRLEREIPTFIFKPS